MHNTNERLEMEVLHSRALEMNGSHESDDDEANSSVYKSKYDRVMKDLDYTKRRMNQQHEDDLDQLASVKKQLEKKRDERGREIWSAWGCCKRLWVFQRNIKSMVVVLSLQW